MIVAPPPLFELRELAVRPHGGADPGFRCATEFEDPQQGTLRGVATTNRRARSTRAASSQFSMAANARAVRSRPSWINSSARQNS
jgi:hypothetical protein